MRTLPALFVLPSNSIQRHAVYNQAKILPRDREASLTVPGSGHWLVTPHGRHDHRLSAYVVVTRIRATSDRQYFPNISSFTMKPKEILYKNKAKSSLKT